jgi:Holliday junction resolvasome RuvABC endonuclease subunit
MQSKREFNKFNAVPDVPSPLVIGVTRARMRAHGGFPKELGTSGTGDGGTGSAMLALDLGTTTGWAMALPDGTIVSGTMAFRPGRYEGGGMRYLRFRSWLDEMLRQAPTLGAVYFEEVRRHVGTDAAHLYGGFLAHLSAWCEQRRLPYQGVPVGVIKRHVTGKGNADKRAVIAAVTARGYTVADDNEADAIAILLWATETAGGVA